MLSSATLDLVDRLVTALMTLVEAVAPRANTPTLPKAAAQSLFFRLTHLVTHLIRISNFGIRASPKPKPTPQPAPAARQSRPTHPSAATSLPRRRGWLLAALPDTAPAVAAEISALLADPAIAALLDRSPSLHRTLRPLLRSLGLDTAPPIPTPPCPPSPTTKPRGAPPPPRASKPILPDPKRTLPTPTPFHAQFIAMSKQKSIAG